MGVEIRTNGNLFIGKPVVSGTSGSLLWVDSSLNLAHNNAELFWDATNKRLGIGTASPVARLDIETDSATEVGIQIMGAASQSADFLQIVNSGGTEKMSILADGTIAFWDGQTDSPTTTHNIIDVGGTLTVGTAGIVGFSMDSNITVVSPGPAFGVLGIFFNYIPTYNLQLASALWSPPLGFNYAPTIIADGVANTALTIFPGFRDNITFNVANGGTWANTSVWKGYESSFTVTGAGTTFGTRTAIKINATTGTGTLVNDIGLDIATLTKGGTANIAIRTGAGGVIQFGNKLTVYNNVTTTNAGVPYLVAEVNLTGQTAAIGATTLYAVPSTGAGLYRVSWVASITTAATTSSVLGGTNGFQVRYTDPTDSVVKTSNPTTVTAFTSAGNTTATTVSGCFVANCKLSTNLQYLYDYTSVGATAMTFKLSIRVEALL